MKKKFLAISLAFGVGAFVLMAGDVVWGGNLGYISDCPLAYSQLNFECQKLCDTTYSTGYERGACHAGCGKMVQAIAIASCHGGVGYCVLIR